jgi:hypothetical protein
MWSLTSPLVGRTSGAENFRSSAKKDFFNSICQQRKSDRAVQTGRCLPFATIQRVFMLVLCYWLISMPNLSGAP